MGNVQRIQRVSRRFKRVFLSLLIVVPLTELSFWLFYNQLPNHEFFLLHESFTSPPDISLRLQLFGVSLLPIGLLLYGIYLLAKLFSLYEKNIVFSRQNVFYYRRLGFVSISWVVSKFIYLPVSSVLISLHQLNNGLTISMGLQSMDLFVLLTGFVVLLISWIMDEARSLEEEQSLTV